MDAVVALVVDIEDPVMAEILLNPELPLLEIGQYGGELLLHHVRAGIGEAGRNKRLAIRANVGAICRHPLLKLERRSRRAVEEVALSFAARHGALAHLFEGSSPGTASFGVRVIHFR